MDENRGGEIRIVYTYERDGAGDSARRTPPGEGIRWGGGAHGGPEGGGQRGGRKLCNESEIVMKEPIIVLGRLGWLGKGGGLLDGV